MTQAALPSWIASMITNYMELSKNRKELVKALDYSGPIPLKRLEIYLVYLKRVENRTPLFEFDIYI